MTELRDRYGLLLSMAYAPAAAHYRTGLDHLLSYDGGVEASLLAALDADHEFALAHAHGPGQRVEACCRRRSPWGACARSACRAPR